MCKVLTVIRLGEELAKATEEGVWVEYLWPHPVTLKEVPKVSYAVRRDGMLFASGYYVQVENPTGRTAAYVQEAIEYYEKQWVGGDNRLVQQRGKP